MTTSRIKGAHFFSNEKCSCRAIVLLATVALTSVAQLSFAQQLATASAAAASSLANQAPQPQLQAPSFLKVRQQPQQFQPQPNTPMQFMAQSRVAQVPAGLTQGAAFGAPAVQSQILGQSSASAMASAGLLPATSQQQSAVSSRAQWRQQFEESQRQEAEEIFRQLSQIENEPTRSLNDCNNWYNMNLKYKQLTQGKYEPRLSESRKEAECDDLDRFFSEARAKMTNFNQMVGQEGRQLEFVTSMINEYLDLKYASGANQELMNEMQAARQGDARFDAGFREVEQFMQFVSGALQLLNPAQEPRPVQATPVVAASQAHLIAQAGSRVGGLHDDDDDDEDELEELDRTLKQIIDKEPNLDDKDYKQLIELGDMLDQILSDGNVDLKSGKFQYLQGTLNAVRAVVLHKASGESNHLLNGPMNVQTLSGTQSLVMNQPQASMMSLPQPTIQASQSSMPLLQPPSLVVSQPPPMPQLSQPLPVPQYQAQPQQQQQQQQQQPPQPQQQLQQEQQQQQQSFQQVQQKQRSAAELKKQAILDEQARDLEIEALKFIPKMPEMPKMFSQENQKPDQAGIEMQQRVQSKGPAQAQAQATAHAQAMASAQTNSQAKSHDDGDKSQSMSKLLSKAGSHFVEKLDELGMKMRSMSQKKMRPGHNQGPLASTQMGQNRVAAGVSAGASAGASASASASAASSVRQ